MWFMTRTGLQDKSYLRKMINFDVSFVLGASVTQVSVATIYMAYAIEGCGRGFESHSDHVY